MGFNLNFLKDLDSETKALRKVGRGAKETVKKGGRAAKKVYHETEDFSNAVVDRGGGSVVRGAIRLGAFASEPLPGEQRKAAKEFIEKYAENEGEKSVAKKTGVGHYDETSVGGRAGRTVGTGISVGTQVVGLNKGAQIGRAAGKGNKVLGFLGSSAGGSVASAIEGTAQGRDVSPGREIATGLAVDLATAGLGRGVRAARDAVKPVFADTSESFIKKLSDETNPANVKKLLKDKVPESSIDTISGAIANTKDKNIINNLLVKAMPTPDAPPAISDVLPNARVPEIPGVSSKDSVAETNKGLKEISDIRKQYGNDKEFFDKVILENQESPGKIGEFARHIASRDAKEGSIYNKNYLTEILDDELSPINTKVDSAISKQAKLEDLKQTARKLERDTGQKGLYSNIAKNMKDMDIDEQIAYMSEGLTKARDNGAMAASHIGVKSTQPKARPETPTIALPTGLKEATVPAAAPKSVDPFEEITGAITGRPATKGQAAETGLGTLRQQQDEILSTERGQRFGKVGKLGESEFGSEGYFKRRAALKGEYTKVQNPYKDKFTPEQSEELFTEASKKIYSTPDSVYERDWKANGLKSPLNATAAKFNTEIAVRKVLGLEPGIPTPSELRLLRVHSPKLAEQVETVIPKHRQLIDWAANLAGSARALKSGLDFSMGGRQGLFVAARHPVQWARANKESVKFAKDEDYFFKKMHQIEEDPWVRVGAEHDMGLQGAKGLKEEAYNNDDFAEKVPGIRRAERAYTGGLSTLRASLWKENLQKFGSTPEEAAEKLGKDGMEGLAESIRTLTGRGGKEGGFIDKRAKTLGEALFSPRLWASRLEPFNPAYWKRIGPAGRKEAFESLASFAGLASVVLGAAAAAGAEVETDPRSSDFLKIKVGDTRYDILGGFQQNLVFGWRQLTGEKKSSTTGDVTKFDRSLVDVITQKSDEEAGVDTGPYTGNRLTVATDLLGNKAAPLVSAGMNIVAGQDKAGNDVNALTEIGQLFVPINVQNIYHGVQDGGPLAAAKSLPEFVGIGSQTYGTKDINLSDKQEKYVEKLKKGGRSDKEIEANEMFFRTLKTVPKKASYYEKIDAALEAGDSAKAKAIAKEYNALLDSKFDEWREKYGTYKNKDLSKEYSSSLIKLDSSAIKSRLKKLKE